ncbi:MAG: hypothetical protein QOI15_404 [Pseudonocardiales bacterium]|nr:hypothetical protein [Pseudonocardiales bacterium]
MDTTFEGMRRAGPLLVVTAVLLAGVVAGVLPAPSGAAQLRHRTTAAFPADARFDYQIGGAYRPAAGVEIVDRDRHAAPAAGRYNICYVNAFQAQPGQLGWWRREHRRLLLHDSAGHEVVDRGWNEVLLDVGTPANRRALAGVIGRWIDGCAQRGFQAIEPDNLDSYTRSRGLLQASDAVAFAAKLTARAHEDGLRIAQKNAVELAGRRSRTGFDFAIAEECQVYHECRGYTRRYGDAVIEIEYTDNGRRAFAAACAARGSRISIELVDRDVRAAGAAAHVRRWCG